MEQESTYQIAMDEYDPDDDNSNHKLIYAYTGLALYHSQCLEESLTIMLWTNRIFEEKVMDNIEINRIIDSIEDSKKTMGALLKEVKQAYKLSERDIDNLQSVLTKRNYITHQFFKMEIFKFSSNTGRREMLKYLCDYIDEAVSIDVSLQEYYKEYTLKMGVTQKRIDEMIEQIKAVELKRDEAM